MEFLKARELAQRLGITVKTVYNLADTGELPAGVKFGKSRRWDWDTVKGFLKEVKNDDISRNNTKS